MTKFLMLGMPLVDVIQASTEAAAASVGWADRIGTLGVGRVAGKVVMLSRFACCPSRSPQKYHYFRHHADAAGAV